MSAWVQVRRLANTYFGVWLGCAVGALAVGVIR